MYKRQILGILAAVAVPKYYDLQKEAADKAAAAVAAEAIARYNMKFSKELLGGGKTCSDALNAAKIEAFGKDDDAAGYGTDWKVTYAVSYTHLFRIRKQFRVIGMQAVYHTPRSRRGRYPVYGKGDLSLLSAFNINV